MLEGAFGLEDKCGVVYECKCESCGQLYVEEMEGSLGEREEEPDKSVKEGIPSQSSVNIR